MNRLPLLKISPETYKAQRNFIVVSVLIFLKNTMEVPLENLRFLGQGATAEFWDIASAALLAGFFILYFIRTLSDSLALLESFDESLDDSFSQFNRNDDVNLDPSVDVRFKLERMMKARKDARLDTSQIERMLKALDRIVLARKAHRVLMLIPYVWLFLVPMIFMAVAGLSYDFDFGMARFRLSSFVNCCP